MPHLSRAPGLLVAALALFAAVAIAVAFNLIELRASSAAVKRTNEVLRTLADLESDLLEAESGERG